MTVHHAQGLTVDTAIVYATDTLYREAGHVAVSRATHRTTLTVTRSRARRRPPTHHCSSQRGAVDGHFGRPETRLAQALRRSAAHEMASR